MNPKTCTLDTTQRYLNDWTSDFEWLDQVCRIKKGKWLDQASEQLNQRFWMGVTDRALALETSWPIKPTKTQRIIYSERAIQWIPLGKSASTPQSQIKPPKGLEKADRLESPQTREPAWSEPNRANQGRLRVERSHLRRRRRGYPATGAAEVSRRSTKLLEGSGNESRARAGEAAEWCVEERRVAAW